MPHDAKSRLRVEQACVEFERSLRAFLMGMLRDPHLVDDVFQKTVVKAMESAADVNPPTMRGWLHQIALNEVRGMKRSESRQARLKKAVWELSTEDAGDSNTGLNAALSGEEQLLIQEALNRLDENYREVVVRRIHRGQTFAVIAEEMEKPIGTVLTWMRRALNQLREMQEVRTLWKSE